jgi:SAM-dependent methyltransferase
MEEKTMKEQWNENLKSEVAFWERWCATKGEKWPDDFQFRINPDNELQEKYKPYINQDSKILDVGSGVYTILGRNLDAKPLKIICTDPLAPEYKKLKAKYSLPEIDVILDMPAEKIDVKRHIEHFDFVHAQNSLDHSFNPVQAFKNMLKVCKPGGYVYTCHEINEGKNENYKGLHQWNFYEDDGFHVSDKDGNAICLSELFKEHKQITEVNQGWITFIIQKSE